MVCYKVRYVAKGYAQCHGINYNKTTAPTVCLESFCTLLHIAALQGWDIQHFDIKMAFLHRVLLENKTMYMEQLSGFEVPGKENWVMKLMKSIYGIKQVSRVWNHTFNKVVKVWGFEQLPSEWCIYCQKSPTGISKMHMLLAVLVVLGLVPASTASTTSTASTASSRSRTRDLPGARHSNTRSSHPSFAPRASFHA